MKTKVLHTLYTYIYVNDCILPEEAEGSSRTKSEHIDKESMSEDRGVANIDLGLSGTSWFIFNLRQLIDATSGSRAIRTWLGFEADPIPACVIATHKDGTPLIS